MLEPDDVAHLARVGRVQPSPRFHGYKHGITIHGARRALLFTRRVERDDRIAPYGGLLHPKGWRAFCRAPDARRFRVDFDLVDDEEGWLLLVVTAVEVT